MLSLCKIHSYAAIISITLGVINAIVLAALLGFAGEGGRNTAEDGFARDAIISELDGRLSNLELHFGDSVTTQAKE